MNQTKMKAYVRLDANNQDIQLIETSIPTIQSDEVLIRVEAFGVGIHDRYYIPTDAKFPYVIGIEGAGIITEIGIEVGKFKIGDRVIFTSVMQSQGGSWATFASTKESSLIPLPANLSFAQGAAISIAGKTALECMREVDLKKGDKLFIAGASGAIGTLVIQLATAGGIEVAASASVKNHQYMQDQGAIKTVDYNDRNWIGQVNKWSEDGVTAALAIQPDTGKDSIQVVKDGGKLITVSGDHVNVTPERNIHVSQMGHQTEYQEMVQLIEDISNGKINLVIENEYDFEDALSALAKTETRHARGKLIVHGEK